MGEGGALVDQEVPVEGLLRGRAPAQTRLRGPEYILYYSDINTIKNSLNG